jgi:hypothetical protein
MHSRHTVAIICVVLGDRSEAPIFPKWVAWLNIVVSIAFLPGVARPRRAVAKRCTRESAIDEGR